MWCITYRRLDLRVTHKVHILTNASSHSSHLKPGKHPSNSPYELNIISYLTEIAVFSFCVTFSQTIVNNQVRMRYLHVMDQGAQDQQKTLYLTILQKAHTLKRGSKITVNSKNLKLFKWNNKKRTFNTFIATDPEEGKNNLIMKIKEVKMMSD